MAKIQYVRDKEGSIVFPMTHERAVKGSDGSLLSDKIAGLAEAVASSTGFISIPLSEFQPLLLSDSLNAHKWYFVYNDSTEELEFIYVGRICAASYKDYARGVTFGEQVKTAYDLAVDEGFVGNLQQWLDSLKGDPGVNNPPVLIVEELPDPPSASTLNKVYWVENVDTGSYDEYVTQFDGQSYQWVCIGSTSIDLSDYVRKDSEVWLTQEEFDALQTKDATKIYNIYEIVSGQ